jgi:cobalamin-dependent methionine synthase I
MSAEGTSKGTMVLPMKGDVQTSVKSVDIILTNNGYSINLGISAD